MFCVFAYFFSLEPGGERLIFLKHEERSETQECKEKRDSGNMGKRQNCERERGGYLAFDAALLWLLWTWVVSFCLAFIIGGLFLCLSLALYCERW